MVRRLVGSALVALALSGCGTGLSALGAATTGSYAALDAAARGGLADDVAAHPSVQLGKPAAFALTPTARPYLAALASHVDPLRTALAERLAADEDVAAGLSAWSRATNAAKLRTLARIATIQAEVMGGPVPSLSIDAAAGADEMAAFLPGADGGAITVSTGVLKSTDPYLAVAAIVHEMRHATQHALLSSLAALPAGSVQATLASAYSASWSAADALGGEATYAYGDYLHLNVEYDAFQTGNRVAELLSGGKYASEGVGFLDVQFDAAARPVFDLLAFGEGLDGASLIGAVNRAQYEYERTLPAGGATRRRPDFAQRRSAR